MDLRGQINTDLRERGWSANDLAIQSGVNPSTLSRYFSGKQSDLTVTQLVDIAKAFGKRAGDFVGQSSVDPRFAPFEPIVEAASGLSPHEKGSLVSILAQQVGMMRGWRSAKTEPANVIPFPTPEPHHEMDDDAMERLTKVMRSAGMEPRKAALGPEREVRFFGRASAGEGIEFFDDIPEEYRQIPQWAWRKGARGVFKAAGESMMDVGIFPNDIMFVKPTPEPSNRSIVICTINKKVFVKELKRDERGVPTQLLSKNTAYKPIEININDEVEFFGEVVGRTGNL